MLYSVSYSHYLTLRQILILFEYLGYPEQYEFIEQRKVKYYPIRPYTRKELQELYGVDFKTLWSYLSQIPHFAGRYSYQQQYRDFDEQDITIIFSDLGRPFVRSEIPLQELPQTENLDFIIETNYVHDRNMLEHIYQRGLKEGYNRGINYALDEILGYKQNHRKHT